MVTYPIMFYGHGACARVCVCGEGRGGVGAWAHGREGRVRVGAASCVLRMEAEREAPCCGRGMAAWLARTREAHGCRQLAPRLQWRQPINTCQHCSHGASCLHSYAWRCGSVWAFLPTTKDRPRTASCGSDQAAGRMSCQPLACASTAPKLDGAVEAHASGRQLMHPALGAFIRAASLQAEMPRELSSSKPTAAALAGAPR